MNSQIPESRGRPSNTPSNSLFRRLSSFQCGLRPLSCSRQPLWVLGLCEAYSQRRNLLSCCWLIKSRLLHTILFRLLIFEHRWNILHLSLLYFILWDLVYRIILTRTYWACSIIPPFSILLNFVWAAEQIKPPSMSSSKSTFQDMTMAFESVSPFKSFGWNIWDHLYFYPVLTFLACCYFLCPSYL